MSVNYTTPERVQSYASDVNAPMVRSATGYGSKLATCHRVTYLHENGRTYSHRVYVMNYGNGGSTYILVNGSVLFLDIDTEYVFNEGITPQHLAA